MKDKSQKELILEHMQDGKPINKYMAFQEYGCMTLAQRIDEIEDHIETGQIKGWKLFRRTVPEHHNAAEYWMITEGLYQKIQNFFPDYNQIKNISKAILDLKTVPNMPIEEVIKRIGWRKAKGKVNAN